MKILHVITSLYTGGAEKLMVDLLPRLKVAGHQVDICLFNATRTQFYDEIERAGIKIIGLGKGNVYNPIIIPKLIKLMRDYDVVHTHNTAAQLFAALGSKFCVTRLVTTEHSTSNRRRKWKWYTSIDRWMYLQYQKIICCSQKVNDYLQSIYALGPSYCITINNGVDIDKFENANATLQLRNNLPEGSKVLTIVGGFRWEKDQDTIIKALTLLSDNYHLFLVGDGVRRNILETMTKKLGLGNRVHFLGFRNDIPQILKSSDYVVMSSHFEGLSLSSVEGMAVGHPMLASNVDGLKQVVEGAGVLFEHADPEDFAMKIKELENNMELYKSVSDACRERAHQYNIQKTVAGYLAVYNELQ